MVAISFAEFLELAFSPRLFFHVNSTRTDGIGRDRKSLVSALLILLQGNEVNVRPSIVQEVCVTDTRAGPVKLYFILSNLSEIHRVEPSLGHVTARTLRACVIDLMTLGPLVRSNSHCASYVGFRLISFNNSSAF